MRNTVLLKQISIVLNLKLLPQALPVMLVLTEA